MKNKKAFTLIEIIGAVLLITILAAGMFGAFVGSQYILNRSRHRMQAFNFSREAHDRLRSAMSYGDSELDEGTDYPESNIGTILTGEMSDMGASLTYDVSDEEADGYKSVMIKVSWIEQSLW